MVWEKPLPQTSPPLGAIIVKPANKLNIEADVLVNVESALLVTLTKVCVEAVEGVTHDKGLVALVDKVVQLEPLLMEYCTVLVPVAREP